MRTTRLLLPVVALAVLLAGCSGDDPAPERDEAPSGPTKTEQATGTDEPTEPDEDASADASADAGDGLADADLAACIQGEWRVDAEAATALTQAMLDLMGSDGAVTITGGLTMTFDDGTMTTTYTDYATEVTMDSGGQEIRFITVQDGPAVQSYTLDGDMLASEPLDMSAVAFTTTTYVDGVLQPDLGSDGDRGVDAMGAGQGDQRAVCGATTLDLIPVVLGLEREDLAVHLVRP